MTAQTRNPVLGFPAARVPAARNGAPGPQPGQHPGQPGRAPARAGHGRAPGAGTSTQDILSSIPASLVVAVIRPVAGRMIREMIKEIQECVPAYAQPLQGEFGKILVTSVERAVLQVAEGIGKPRIDRQRWEEWFRHVGRVEFHEGRSMDSLQTAVRVSTRVGWRHIRAAGVAIGMPTDTLFTFADALFQYGDELCGVAIAGYAEAQARASGTMERRRQRLLKLLLSGDPGSGQAIADLAGVTDWSLPEQVAVVALEYRDDQHQLPVSSLGRDVLVDLEGTDPCLVVSDPQTQLAGLEQELAGRRAAIGPLVPLTEAANSYQCAQRALVLASRGVLPDQRIIHCAEHVTTLALCADEFLLQHLTTRALAPFEGLTDKQRTRLCETLLAWLGTRGGVNEIAARLDVHAQTVRYRMNQVSRLLGDRLDDPDQRLMLSIALRATRIVGGDPAARPAG